MALLSTGFPSIFDMQIPAAKLCLEYRVLPHYGTYQGKYKISRRLLVQAGRKSSKKRTSQIEDDVFLLQGDGHAILLGPISGALTVPALLPKEEYLSSQEFSNSQISPLNGSRKDGKQDSLKIEKFEMGDNIHNMDKSSLSLEEFLKMQQQTAPINARANKFNGKMSVSSVATRGIAHVDEQDDSKDAANQNGMVEVWEGDLGPMTPEEEKELLVRAQRELQKLEEMHPSAKFISEKGFIRSEPVGDFDIQKAVEGSLDSDRSVESSDDTEKKGIPAVMRCFDRAKIYVKAGNGGNGVVAFRREKYVPFGGPSGGNGGDGGKVFIEADFSLNSLLSFRKSVHFRAGRGSHGQGKSQEGAKGEDCVVKVPPGTIVRRASDGPTATGEVLLELTSPGQRELLLPGGRGGRGNTAFKSGRNKAPILAESGEDGAEMWIDLELKLVADVGIIGVPNAGKSTLLAAVSAARPAIANYPFTTLLPNLGVVSLDFDATMVLADLPGLLEGAHLGYGLGHEFLRHTERCRVLVHVIDGLSQQPEYEYEAVRLELELFNPELSHKPAVIAYNKMDVPEVSDRWQLFRSNMEQKGVKVYSMSAATTQGTSEIMHAVYNLLKNSTVNDNPSDRTGAVEVGEMVRRQRNAPISEFKVTPYKHLRVWEVHGVGLERFTQMTNWEYLEAVQRFQRVLDVSGVNAALKRSGIQEGDTVVVGQREFVWHDSNDVMNAGEWERGYRGIKKWPH